MTTQTEKKMVSLRDATRKQKIRFLDYWASEDPQMDDPTAIEIPGMVVDGPIQINVVDKLAKQLCILYRDDMGGPRPNDKEVAAWVANGFHLWKVLPPETLIQIG